MGAERQRRLDHEVTEIHSQVKRSSLVLRQRMKELQQEMESWDSLGGTENGESEEYPC